MDDESLTTGDDSPGASLIKLARQAENDGDTSRMETIQTLLESRLRELRPFVRESMWIEEMLAQLNQGQLGGMEGAGTRSSLHLADGAGIRKPLEMRKMEIEELVRSRPGIRPSEIARACRLTTSRASQITKEMVAEGTIARTGKGFEIPA